MRRREFITLAGGAVAWPVAAGAQQVATRTVGWLAGSNQAANEPGITAVRQALNAQGFVEGRNLAFEFRFAEGQANRLEGLAADLLRRPLDVVITSGAMSRGNPAIQALNPSLPIVFYGGLDPVQAGVAPSLNRPGGNITGVFVADLGSKRLGLLHELLPSVTTFAVLVNPTNGASPVEAAEIQRAAAVLGLQINVVNASTEGEIYSAFENMAQTSAQALLVTLNPFFTSAARQIVALAERFAIPALYTARVYATAGGLVSYNSSVAENYRIVGDYVGRILKGTKAGDLPIQRPTKFELIINLKTAKALNFTIPNTLLAIADEVIE